MTTTSSTLENVQGHFVAWARPKHTSMTDDFFSNGYVTISSACLEWRGTRSLSTRVVSKRQKRWSGCFDKILQYFEKKTESSNSESWHRWFVQNSRLLSIGQFEHGWITCKKEEDLRRDSSIAWIDSLLVPSYIFEQFKATLEENTLILHSQDNVLLPSDFAGLIYQRWKLPGYALDHSIWIDSRWQRRQEMETCGICSLQPWTQMFIDHYREKDYDVTKPRIAACTNTIGRYTNTQCIGVIWELLRAEGLQFYQTRSHAIILHNILPPMCIEKVVVSKSGEERKNKTYQSLVAPQRIVLKPKLELWTPGHYKLRLDNVFRSFWRARWNVQGNLSRWNRLQDPRIAPFGSPRTRSHPQTGTPEIGSPVRESPEQRSTTSRPTTNSRVQSVQRAVEGNDLQHGTHGVLRDLRDHSQHTMLQLYDILVKRYCILAAHAEHAYDLQTKFENSTVTATMFCQYPITSSKRARHMGDATGTRKGS